MKNVKLEDLYKKYPFMYEVDGEIYVIGHGVFKKNDSGIAAEYFSRYREYIDRIGRENIQPYELDDVDADGLIYLYKKVLAYADIAHTEYDKDFKTNLFEFISELGNEKKDMLYAQLEDFIRSFWYYNRRFER